MSDSLGLSVGTTNLVATAAGRSTVIRRSVLTVYPDRPAEVGVPGENPNLDVPQPDSLVLTGFVERVGDPIPLVAADGSAHQAERVLAEFPVQRLRLKLSNPGAVRGARAVGVSIERTREA